MSAEEDRTDPAEPDARLIAPAAEVSWWVREEAPPGLGAVLAGFFPAWLADVWPLATVQFPFGELD